ncbi:MAG TPA: glycosyltransferase family 2 protein [Vicinamibacterales bacterium]|nr:glycosyltransferase family 2 protein [Vicinamibacterales bacterium]
MPAAPRLSILVPVYNNEATIPELLDRLRKALDGLDYEAVVVNDGSHDKSLALLKAQAVADPRLKVISFSRNFGQHPAIAAALEHAQGDVLVLMDADLEDRPENIPMLVRTLQERQCDIVYTTKIDGTVTPRGLSSDAYHQVFSRTIGVTVPRRLGTFRAFTRKVGDALRAFPERDVVYGPLMFYVGFNFAIVPVDRGTRPGGSSYTLAKRLGLAVNSLITYSDLAPKVFASAGAVMIAAPLLYGGIVLLQYLLAGRTLPQGLTIIVLLLSFLGGTIMLALGVLGVYVFRIFQEVLARPRYVIDETMNLERSIHGRS